ncbi:MAG: cyclic lactone autoinducer peptide [Ruminococcus sp.]|nr:cyclic lactone autoinducer peptide [Ruminococcus sp.]
MRSLKNGVLKKSISNIALFMAKVANGTASANFSYQPKEPKNLKEMLKRK